MLLYIMRSPETDYNHLMKLVKMSFEIMMQTHYFKPICNSLSASEHLKQFFPLKNILNLVNE